MKALIGHSGFVGTTLRRQASFDALYRSGDIGQIRGRAFEEVVCAGVPAQKWIAERNPEADIANIRSLADHLSTINAQLFILISSVDVFADSRGADERTAPEESKLTAYGRHRLWLERFVVRQFPRSLIVRLPGLVGPGLRKNALFDLRNDNALHLLDGRSVYQFYPTVNLWSDIEASVAAGLGLVHFAVEPLSVQEAAHDGFGRQIATAHRDRAPAAYDLRTRHAGLLEGTGPYLYRKRETLLAIRAYAQSEPPSKPLA